MVTDYVVLVILTFIEELINFVRGSKPHKTHPSTDPFWKKGVVQLYSIQ